MSSASNEKLLIFTISLGASTFGNTKNKTVKIEGLRATAEIDKAGGMAMSTAKVRIFGLAIETMNQLTMLSWQSLGIVKNTIQIEAKDGDTQTTVFFGQIINAWPDFSGSPDVFMYFESQAGFFDQVAAAAPTSHKGVVSVSQIMSSLAARMGMAFENNGVTAKITDPYYPGTTLEQAKSLAKAANIDLYIDDFTLAITPKGKARGTEIPLITPETGLIGYPTFDKIGVTFKTFFNPAIMFGGMVKIETIIKPAAGTWRATGVTHSLSCYLPDGKWESIIRCTESGLVPVK